MLMKVPVNLDHQILPQFIISPTLSFSLICVCLLLVYPYQSQYQGEPFLCFADNPGDLVLPTQDTWEDDLTFDHVIGYGKSTPLLNVLYQFAAKGGGGQYIYFTLRINKLLIALYYLWISLFRG